MEIEFYKIVTGEHLPSQESYIVVSDGGVFDYEGRGILGQNCYRNFDVDWRIVE